MVWNTLYGSTLLSLLSFCKTFFIRNQILPYGKSLDTVRISHPELSLSKLPWGGVLFKGGSFESRGLFSSSQNMTRNNFAVRLKTADKLAYNEGMSMPVYVESRRRCQ